MRALAVVTLLGLALLAGCTQHRSQTECMPIVAVYPSWKQQLLPPEQIPWHHITHVVLVFALPTPEGELDTRALDGLLKPVVQAAHRQG